MPIINLLFLVVFFLPGLVICLVQNLNYPPIKPLDLVACTVILSICLQVGCAFFLAPFVGVDLEGLLRSMLIANALALIFAALSLLVKALPRLVKWTR